MGLQIRDDRQMKALTGLSHDQFHYLLPVFSDIYQATQQKTYEAGLTSGTRVRKPGGGCKGKLPTMAEKLLFVLFYYKKPRKSHKNPAPHLSDEQKAANTALSRIRIFVEHAIGGMKRYDILVHKFRNHKKDFEDDM